MFLGRYFIVHAFIIDSGLWLAESHACTFLSQQ
jgi:hypothetical protein